MLFLQASSIDSLPAHIDEIKILLQEQNFHILALNETKIDADFPSELLKVVHNFFGGNSGKFRSSFSLVVTAFGRDFLQKTSHFHGKECQLKAEWITDPY